MFIEILFTYVCYFMTINWHFGHSTWRKYLLRQRLCRKMISVSAWHCNVRIIQCLVRVIASLNISVFCRISNFQFISQRESKVAILFSTAFWVSRKDRNQNKFNSDEDIFIILSSYKWAMSFAIYIFFPNSFPACWPE